MFYFLRKESESRFSPNCHRPEVHQMLRMMIYKNSFFDNKRFEKWESEQEMLRMMILVRERGNEEKKKWEKKLNMRWTFFNPWILCVLRVSHLNKNGRKRESYKREGSLSLFFWIQSFHWIYVWPNKWIEDRREIERSEGGVGVEMWFQTLASFLYTKQRNPGCGKCHRASLFGLPLRIDVRSTHEMAISTIATKIQNSI